MKGASLPQNSLLSPLLSLQPLRTFVFFSYTLFSAVSRTNYAFGFVAPQVEAVLDPAGSSDLAGCADLTYVQVLWYAVGYGRYARGAERY